MSRSQKVFAPGSGYHAAYGPWPAFVDEQGRRRCLEDSTTESIEWRWGSYQAKMANRRERRAAREMLYEGFVEWLIESESNDE